MNLSLPKQSFNVEKVLEVRENSCHLKLKTRGGYGEVLVYQICSGALVVYFSYQTREYILNPNRREHILEINYCVSGRFENILTNGQLQYLGRGEMTVNLESSRESRQGADVFMPLGYCEDIAVILDLNESETLSKVFAPCAQLNLSSLVDRLMSYGETTRFPPPDCIRQMAEIPEYLPDEARIAWLKTKVDELLLYLAFSPFSHEQIHRTFDRRQVEIIKDIQRELVSDLAHNITIEELARRHFMSSTTLKTSFRDIYGVSIGAYRKRYRMEQAAELLRDTELRVEEIAVSLGYQSASKFGAAYKSIMGCSPLRYRKEHQSK